GERIKFILSKETTVFLLLLAFLIADRLVLLFNFSFDYVGSDDLIYWLGARDYSQGIFHEPYFYGQDYNFMLEALFAVPLIKLNVPFNYALPISTSFISLFPFILFAVVLFRKGFKPASFIFLLIPLTLPIEYGITCSMSRGFVSGLFFSGFFVFPLLQPGKKQSWVILALALGLGYIFNPNSLIIAFPVCLYMLINNYKQPFFYIICAVTLCPVLWLEYLAKDFYNQNPDYNLHPMVELNFKADLLLKNLQCLDNFYTFFTPVIWLAGWFILLVIFCLALWIWKRDKARTIILLLTLLLIFLTLGVNKVNDRTDNLLLSSSRMYLAIPLLTGLVFLWCSQLFSLNNRVLVPSIFSIGLLFLCVKISIMGPVIRFNTEVTNRG
ncbi:MAG: hypothetical protein HYZ42_08795, partial [Bacteroidetes bacterium]|nr:hypothetical protein [Bacteroidota bacterium]